MATNLSDTHDLRFEKKPTTEILSDVSAFCKPGEMLLVLGRPGSGCSTLLRCIANMRDTFVSVEGETSYGGIDASEFGRYRGEAVYTPEEDFHNPFLSVRETLDFALRCKTPAGRLPDETRKNFREKMIELLTKMFGLQRQLDTVVGNEFIRGLSGGERKRVTLIEAMITHASITCWDCGTRGLDAASAFDYVQCLRIMTDVLGKTTVCSFYQASESMYNLFDRVAVMDKGRLIYFGPAKEAKQYFVGLGFKCEPRKSTPDFLTGVTNPQERIVRKKFANKAPQTSFEFEAAWKASKECKRATEAQAEFEEEVEKQNPSQDFRDEVKRQRQSWIHKESPYTANFLTQVVACTIKEAKLRWRNKFGLVSRYISIMFQAFIYASCFFLMPENLNGLYSRGGAIFSAAFMNTVTALGDVPVIFFGRLTVQKHKSYAMYHPAAFHLGQVLIDIPFLFGQAFIYTIISYWMYGLVADANRFFIYLFTVFLTAMTMTSFFRMVGNLCPTMAFADQVEHIILMSLLTYSGFVIPYTQMRPWFQWFTWINPLAYSFKGLFINELHDRQFDCSDSAVPFGPGYNDTAHRVCPIPNSVPGNMNISGSEYVQTIFGIDPELMSLDIVVVFLFFCLLTLFNCLAVEFLEFTGGGYTKKVYKSGKAPKEATQEEERSRAKHLEEAREDMGKTLETTQSFLMWRKMCYTVPVPGPEKKRQLLDNIDGWIKPGQMTALMGASGAGKTTLLDVLAQRKTIGKISGEILLNEKPIGVDFERITGYVEQMDVFNPYLTVREALRFSAKLRQERHVSIEEKYSYVEKILAMMEMEHLGDALIGDLQWGMGISVEERKRLTIGMELVAKPHIMFLDGLDAQSSYNIIRFIRKLADTGMPLVCTIHQPSATLFEHFDRLLLLAKGGKVAYFGDIGANSGTLIKYFTDHGVRACGKDENPAEYILEAIGAGVHGSSTVDWPEVWKGSKEYSQAQQELSELSGNFKEPEEAPREFATSQIYQFWEVYKRMNVIWWRSPFYNLGRLFNATYVGLVLGFSYFDLGNSASDLRSRVYLLYTSMIVGILFIFASLPSVSEQREYFRRDYASKFYSWCPFALSIVLVEIPYTAIITSVSFLSFYWTAGLESDSIGGFYFWLAMNAFMSYCVAVGQSIAALTPHVIVAFTLTPVVINFLMLFCGVLNPPSAMPEFWRSWAYPLMPSRYYLEGVLTDVLVDVNIRCSAADMNNFLPPANVTCGDYAAQFLANNTGYINNPSASSPDLCEYCQYSKGADYYESFIGWDYSYIWRDFGIVICYWAAAAIATIAFVWLNRKPTR